MEPDKVSEAAGSPPSKALPGSAAGFHPPSPGSPAARQSPSHDQGLAPDAPPWAAVGLAALRLGDPLLGAIPDECGPLPWRRRAAGFPGLLRAICGQQISNRAAGAIWTRLRAIPGALDPSVMAALDDAVLCGVGGLSRPKAAHARALAAAVLDGSLRLDGLTAMGDAEAVAHLTATRGLGPWTATVHLLFAEDRADLFPEGDLALGASLADLRGLAERPSHRALAEAAVGWAPWRSLAARLLWHRWRHLTGRPGTDLEDDG